MNDAAPTPVLEPEGAAGLVAGVLITLAVHVALALAYVFGVAHGAAAGVPEQPLPALGFEAVDLVALDVLGSSSEPFSGKALARSPHSVHSGT